MNKEVKIGIAACIVLVLLVAGLIWWPRYDYQRHLVKSVDRHLSQDDQKIYEDRISKADEGLVNASADDKYNLLETKGVNLYGLGRLEDARKVLEEAIKFKPDLLAAYTVLAQVETEMMDYKAALTTFESALKISPVNATLWKKYIQLQTDQFKADNNKIDSIYQDALNKTIINGVPNVDIVTSYASWLEKSGDLAKAKEYWQKAITINDSGKKAYDAEIKRIDGLLNAQ